MTDAAKKVSDGRCEAGSWSGAGRFSHHQRCQNRAKVCRDGKDYCGIHDPLRVKDRRAKQEAKYEAERKLSSAKYSYLNARMEAADELEKLSPDDFTGHPALRATMIALGEAKVAYKNLLTPSVDTKGDSHEP